VTREAFDFGEVVGRDEYRGFCGALEKTFDELIADERIEAAKRFIENDEAGVEGEGAGKSEFHLHAAGESFDFAVERQLKLFD